MAIMTTTMTTIMIMTMIMGTTAAMAVMMATTDTVGMVDMMGMGAMAGTVEDTKVAMVATVEGGKR